MSLIIPVYIEGFSDHPRLVNDMLVLRCPHELQGIRRRLLGAVNLCKHIDLDLGLELPYILPRLYAYFEEGAVFRDP